MKKDMICEHPSRERVVKVARELGRQECESLDIDPDSIDVEKCDIDPDSIDVEKCPKIMSEAGLILAVELLWDIRELLDK